jgi:peptidoglycan/xylan/chitin deacetylase (PgdA/CDA1 family)
MVHLARVQGGQQIQTGDIWLIFRGLEFAAQRRNRVRGAVSGWALIKIGLFILLMAAAVGCNGRLWTRASSAPLIRTDRFVIVTVKKGETLQSLARDHLNDGSKGPIIAAYNRIDAVLAGQRLVIPLQPTQYGGLTTQGYQTVPILLYTQMKRTAKTENGVSPKTFEHQMNFLTAAKFETITLDQFFGFVQLADQLPANAVMICFDGADRWIYDIGFPVLRREKLKAALFIPVDQIGQPGKLTWIELNEMAANGIDIGVLGKEIMLTPGKDPDKHLNDLEREIVAARKAIEQYFNPAGHYFAYPQGKTDDLTIALLKKHGYRLGFTRKGGSNPFFVNNFDIRRTIIKDQSSMQQFQKNLITFQKAPLK